MNLAVVCAHYGADSLSEAVLSWGSDVPLFIVDGSKGMLPAYQQGYLKTEGYDVLAYLHDDTLTHDPQWQARVLRQFEDPNVAVVGFGGAAGHGNREIYKAPYDYRQLARHDFMSNMRDAENHGRRFTGDRDVATLDGFALIIRRSFLTLIGGWPIGTPINYIAYDYYITLMARRHRFKVRLCGLDCTHYGGRTFVARKVGEQEDHWAKYLAAHEFCYREFRDVLPFHVEAR